jgi:hypothetical protein
MRPLSRSLATSGLSSKRGTSPESELVPQHSNRHARWRRQRARTSGQRGGPKDTARQQVVRVEVVASGRRRVPSAVGARQDGGWKAGRERPRCRVTDAAPARVCGGRSRPAVSMSGEARAQAPSSGESAGAGRHPICLAACLRVDRPDGHHVREHARSARRRARFSAALQPRAPHAARACPSWVLDYCRFQ